MVSLASRRTVSDYLQTTYQVSEKRLCRLINLKRTTKRNRPRTDRDQELRIEIHRLSMRYPRFGYRKIHIIFTVERKPFSLRCPCCKGLDIIRHGALPRWFNSVPLGGRPSYIVTYVTRVECKQCSIIRQADIGFADKRVTYTKALERYALGLARYMTIKDVAIHLGISWDIVKGMQKRYLKKRYKNPCASLKGPVEIPLR